MFVSNVVLVLSSLFIFCDAEFADTLTKCSIKDNGCLMSLYQNIINNIGDTGIPEVDIPPLNNLRLTNISLTVLEAIRFTITDATVNGITECVFNKFSVDMEALSSDEDVTCDIIIQGKFSATGTSPALEALLGKGLISEQWDGKIKLDKVNLQVVTPFIIFTKDGENYFKHLPKKVSYKYDVKKATFFFENIKIGNNDISKLIMDFMNANWKNLLESSKKEIFNKALEIFFSISKNFFGGVPTRKYIIEDLSPYVKN